MTTREYLQSLKDQGKTKEEAIKLAQQFEIDNKQTKVEKPQATATDAAPVVASPTDSTESKPEDTSLALQEIDSKNLSSEAPKIEEDDKKSKKYKIPKNNQGLPKGDKVDILETITVTDDFNIPKISLDPKTTRKLEGSNYTYENLEKTLLEMFIRDEGKENLYNTTGNLSTGKFEIPISDVKLIYDNYKKTGEIDADLAINEDYKINNRTFSSKQNLVEFRKLHIPLTKPFSSTVI